MQAAKALFGAGVDTENMPSTEIAADLFIDNAVSVIDLLVATGLVTSKGQARRLIEQGGITVDDEKIKDFNETISIDKFDKGYVVIRKGKKVFHKAVKA